MSGFIVSRRGEFMVLAFLVRLERFVDGYIWITGGILDGMNAAKIRRSSGRSWAGASARIL